MTGDADPYRIVGPEQPQPPTSRSWGARLLVGGVVALLTLAVGAAAAVGLVSDYRNGVEPFCIGDDVVASVQEEVVALVPGGATDVRMAVADCDDGRTVSADFTDPAADADSLSAAALARGWAVTSTAGCFQKERDGRPFRLWFETYSPGDPAPEGRSTLAVGPGDC